MCQDLQDIFHGINPNISDYTVLGFALVPYQSELPIYIDEVSFTEYSRTVPQVCTVWMDGGTYFVCDLQGMINVFPTKSCSPTQ